MAYWTRHGEEWRADGTDTKSVDDSRTGPFRSVSAGVQYKYPVVEVRRMSDRKFTLIELHLDGDTQFGPRTISDALPFGASETADEEAVLEEFEEEEEEAAAADEESGGPGAIGALIVLGVLVAAGVAVKKYRGGDEEDLEEEEEQPDVIVN